MLYSFALKIKIFLGKLGLSKSHYIIFIKGQKNTKAPRLLRRGAFFVKERFI